MKISRNDFVKLNKSITLGQDLSSLKDNKVYVVEECLGSEFVKLENDEDYYRVFLFRHASNSEIRNYKINKIIEGINE